MARINFHLVAMKGVGTEVPGQLLVTAGENVTRPNSAVAVAMLCGASPVALFGQDPGECLDGPSAGLRDQVQGSL